MAITIKSFQLTPRIADRSTCREEVKGFQTKNLPCFAKSSVSVELVENHHQILHAIIRLGSKGKKHQERKFVWFCSAGCRGIVEFITRKTRMVGIRR